MIYIWGIEKMAVSSQVIGKLGSELVLEEEGWVMAFLE
jgi:hypothetical protein